MFAGRPLLEALKKYHCDYLFQVKDNQPKVHAEMEEIFKDAPQQEPDDCLEREIVDVPPQQRKKRKSYDRKVNKQCPFWGGCCDTPRISMSAVHLGVRRGRS